MKSGRAAKYTVAGIGELLWDVFPEGRRPGGAPMNFACHCSQLGAAGFAVSCVGNDSAGMDLLERLRTLRVDVSCIAEVSGYPTGTVQVTLDESGKPAYRIADPAAWDRLPVSAEMEALAGRADAVCFGSLGQRSDVSRRAIRSFLRAMRPGTLKIFDVNLRQTFYSEEIITSSLELATVLKLSDEELPVLAAMYGLSGSVSAQLSGLLDRFRLDLVACTCGANGSLLMTPAETDRHPGYPGKAVDSVGAGDSFAAALCMGLLNGVPLKKINDHANRVAAFVCSQPGAIPEIPVRLRKMNDQEEIYNEAQSEAVFLGADIGAGRIPVRV